MTSTSLVRQLPICLLVSLSVLGCPVVEAQDPLTYKDRGDRYEGVKPKPVSGYDIELLGARVEPPASASAGLPENLAVRFFLEHTEEVYITVRERDPLEFYWLDNVRPTQAWRPGATNVFTWPSSDVLRPLGLASSDLVTLVRLGRRRPSLRERVAPVIFGGPQPVTAYRFTFKVNATAKIRHRIFGPASAETPIASGLERRRSFDAPFDIRWQAAAHPEGLYRLVLEGYYLNDNSRFVQEVEFFHTASWPR